MPIKKNIFFILFWNYRSSMFVLLITERLFQNIFLTKKLFNQNEQITK